MAEKSPFYLLYIFGPGGVGKSTLLQELMVLCRQQTVSAISIDARHVEPSPDAFILALQMAMALGSETSALETLAEQPQRRVIFIDTYEKLAPLDGWLREVFLPQLSENILLVLAGREALSTGWRIDPGWNTLIRTVALRNLSPEESRAYLSQRRVSPEQHQAVLNFTRGHPLALSLVAEVLDQREDQQFSPEEAPDVIKTLLEHFVQKVPSPAHRLALESCGLLSVIMEPLLAELFQVDDARELFEWLRALSFIEQRRVLFAYIYLHRNNPVVRAVFEWQESGNVWTEVARPTDVPALLAMVERHEGEDSSRVAAYWLNRSLSAVQVFRSSEQTPAGFLMLLTLDQVTEEMLAVDPALAKAWNYLQHQAPLRSGEKFTYFRYWMAGDTYQSLSPTQSRIFINMVQHYFSTPGLAYTFLPCADPEAWAQVSAYADLARIPELDFEIGGRSFGIYVHDWRTLPPMAWLDLLAGRELLQEEYYAAAPKASPTVVLSEADFAAAIHDALRAYCRPETLRQSLLLNSRLVMEQSGPAADKSARVAVLLELIKKATESLQSSPREAKCYRALHRTYFNPAVSQELAAEALDLPFSTYRRHLKTGVARVTEILWNKEITA